MGRPAAIRFDRDAIFTPRAMISVVIPSYNRRDCVLALLSDLYAQQGVEMEVIVVDDCSPDDSVEAIRRGFPQATVLLNEKNGGPAVSRNRGILAARGEAVWASCWSPSRAH